MKKTREYGFSAIEIILGVVVIAAIIGIGWYVYNANQTKNNTTTPSTSQQSPDSTPASTIQYLTIKEWGIKVPLTDATKDASYRYENGYMYLDVAVEGDTTGACKNQATISRLTANQDGRETSMVGNYYYLITGSQAACTTDATVQSAASAIRQAWMSQASAIIAE